MTEPGRGGPAAPALTGVVVHWRNEQQLARLLAAWPNDARFELIVVDNGSRAPLPGGPGRVLAPGRNLGFAGGCNLGTRAARAPIVLLLNPDARPAPGALDAVLDGFALHGDAAALAPRLVGPAGEPQWRWQLKPLPTLTSLFAQALTLPARAAAAEPSEGSAIEQPACAALAVRREVLFDLGGLDERFHPAWFEDVDLARRMRNRGVRTVYWPRAVFTHEAAGSVAEIGYRRFLWAYDRSLLAYLRKHHGAAAAAVGRALVPLGALARLALLPIRRPRHAASRRTAEAALLAVSAGAVSGWRWPR